MKRARRRARRRRTPPEELHNPLDEETEKTPEGEQAFSAQSNDEARSASEGDAADKVMTIWRQRLEDDPEAALDEIGATVKELGYQLAYAGHTFGAPLTKRTYYILNPDKRERIDVFHDGNVGMTLLDVCLWSEVAFKRWRNSDTPSSNSADGKHYNQWGTAPER